CLALLLIAASVYPRALPPFPTRRSSDLIGLVSALLDEGLTVPCQLADRADRRWRNEAGTQQPVPQKVGEPFGILDVGLLPRHGPDRKSTRLNSSHGSISYAVFCLKKKNT